VDNQLFVIGGRISDMEPISVDVYVLDMSDLPDVLFHHHKQSRKTALINPVQI